MSYIADFTAIGVAIFSVGFSVWMVIELFKQS